MTRIRHPVVAGRFYPADAHSLRSQVCDYISRAPPVAAAPAPKAVIAPHAGYSASGVVAGRAYAVLKPAGEIIRRVVLLGPAHYVPFHGLAASSAEAFETPLGTIPVDRESNAAVLALPGVRTNDDAHRGEHSLEVHLPFLQESLDAFSIVPLLVGKATAEEVAAVLETLWGGNETRFVISSDLSHYLDYHAAQAADRRTTALIEGLQPERLASKGACGFMAIRGMLCTAKKHGLSVETLGLGNSGDTLGERDSVVGYGAYAFYEDRNGEGQP